MKKTIKTTAAVLALSVLSACGSSNKNKNLTVDANAILSNTALSSVQKAEQLALGAEQLATPLNFMYADTVAETALKQDPQNKRAQFYRAFLAQPMVMRGILSRIKPLAYKSEESKKTYNDAVANLPNSGLKTFLFDGKEDIKTEKDVQGFIDEVHRAQDTFRKFLKANKDMELTLNVSESLAGQALENEAESCIAKEVKPGVFEATNCDFTQALQVKLNRADIELLQQVTAGLQVYTAMLTSYDLSGAVAASDKKIGATNAEVWSELEKNSDFGRVRNSGAALKLIPTLGLDGVAAVRWALKMQDQFCPNGQPSMRKGYLVEHGVCVKAKTKNGERVSTILHIVEAAMNGQSITAPIGDGRETEVRPAALFSNPIPDLKSLKPNFNECGEIVSISDSSFGGVFPRKDFNELSAISSQCGQ